MKAGGYNVGMSVSSASSPRWPWRPTFRRVLGLSAVVFGVMTIVSGGTVLFGGTAARTEAGDVVGFVLLFNIGAGFAYIVAGVGAAMSKRWALYLARVLAGTTLVIFAALGVHIALGGAFETRTVVAMTMRSAFWVGQAFALAHIARNVRCV